MNKLQLIFVLLLVSCSQSNQKKDDSHKDINLDSVSPSNWKKEILQSYKDHADDTIDWRSGPHDDNILHTLEAPDTVYTVMKWYLSSSAKKEFCASRLSKISFDFDDDGEVRTFPPLQHNILFTKDRKPVYKQLKRIFEKDSVDGYGLTFYLRKDKLCKY